MNRSQIGIWCGATALIGGGMLFLTPVHADAANRPTPDGDKPAESGLVKPFPSRGVPCDRPRAAVHAAGRIGLVERRKVQGTCQAIDRS